MRQPWRQELPEFLHFLERDLNCRLRLHQEVLQFDVYTVDFSAWKLRFSDRTPVIWVKEEDLRTSPPRELVQSVTEVVHSRNFTERNPIVLVDGPGEAFRQRFQIAFLPVLVLEGDDQRAVMTSRRPQGELLDRLSAQLPLAQLAPYETSKPVTGSRFFGREYEIRRILQGSDSNFAIMGVRRIGKTSLMREIERRLLEQVLEQSDQDAAGRVIYMDCSAITSPYHFMQEVVRKLQPRELVRLDHKQYPIYFPDFLDRMSRRYGGPLTFLLDEFDRLLTWQYDDETLLGALRASSNMGHARFVVAGFRDLMRAGSDLDSPVFNFATPIHLKEFSRDQTAEMVVGPLELLRVHLERPNELVDRIYQETAGQPNLVQYYCSILVDRLDRHRSRTLSPDDLFDVYNSESFRAFVLSTFMDNTTHLEKAVVFAVIVEHGAENTFELEGIDRALRNQGFQILLSDLDQACRNLELAGTFVRQGRQYRFTTPVFPRMLDENYNVEFLFRKIVEEGIW